MFTRRLLLGGIAGAAALGLPLLAAQAADHKLEISLETSPNHLRNISILKMAEELEKRSGGKLEVKVYHGAAKYKDTDVPKALNQGALDMGIPVTYHLGKYVAGFDAVDLPLFYGRTREEIYKFCDGPAGQELGAELEKKLGVKIIGKWLDLGHAQTFTVSKALNAWTDMKNLKIRTPGGAANVARYEILGANPLKIAWPDVPQALQRGTVDGVMTTFESVRSAKLWDSGLKHAYHNNQAFTQYVPMISLKSWNKYPKEIQDLITTVWAENIDKFRDFGNGRQIEAIAEAKKNNMIVVEPTKEDLAEARLRLMAKQDELIQQLKIDPALVKKIAASFGD
jgi:C4-dicarboxylate-binding protein DctP